jgi:hypothetical protein
LVPHWTSEVGGQSPLGGPSRDAKIDVGDAAIMRMSGVNGEIGRASIGTRRPAAKIPLSGELFACARIMGTAFRRTAGLHRR